MEIRIYKDGYLIDVLKAKEEMFKYPGHDYKLIDDKGKEEFGTVPKSPDVAEEIGINKEEGNTK